MPAGDTTPVTGPTDVQGTGRAERGSYHAHLSEIVDILNERFGTDFTREDQLFFDQIVGDLKKDEELAVIKPGNNTLEQFKLAFDPKGAMAAVLERMESGNEENLL